MVVEMTVDGAGAIGAESVYRAVVRNQAKLAYSGVGAWLEGAGALPAAAAAVAGLADNLRLQDQVAQRLKAYRHEHGALELETIEVHALFDGDAVSGLAAERRNRAKELIEDFMIAANGAIARFLEGKRLPGHAPGRALAGALAAHRRSRRVARRPSCRPSPTRRRSTTSCWRRRAADPLRFPDLSLVGHQAARPGRVRGELPRAGRDRPLRPRGERVHALDRAQPALPGPHHAAAAQGGAGGRAVALRAGRS